MDETPVIGLRSSMAFFQETRPAREPFLNAPSSVLWLIAAIVAAHLARIWGGLPDELAYDYAFVPARYAGENIAPVSVAGQVLPFVTYLFLHANLTHLAINCLWLLAFGPAVARRAGPLRFVAFFLACGIGAALAHLIVYWGSEGPVIGASGGVAGLMAAGMRVLYGERRAPPGRTPFLAPVFSRQMLRFTLLWVGLNVLVGVTGFGMTGDLSLIAWVAHLGGYFTGLFAVGLFEPRPASAPA
jgi:membrane associated rhomboid family serine protease